MSRQLQSCVWGACVAAPAVIGGPQPAQAERCTRRGSSHSSEMLRTTARRACSAPAMRCRDGRRAPEQDRHRTREPAPACSAARQGPSEAVRSSFCTQGSKQAPSGSRGPPRPEPSASAALRACLRDLLMKACWPRPERAGACSRYARGAACAEGAHHSRLANWACFCQIDRQHPGGLCICGRP